MSDSGRSGGCVTTILAILLLWALLFGVTIGGRHYKLSCSKDKGVEIPAP